MCILRRYLDFNLSETCLVPVLVESLRKELLTCKPCTEAIAAIIPNNQFWRWKEMWQYTIRSAVFAAALMEFLVNDELLTIAQVADILGSECIGF